LERVSRPPLPAGRIVDTLALARRRHPAGPNTLDALCKRYGIDLSQRTKHGALLDSMLLAGVYVELLGERQATLVFAGNGAASMTRASAGRAATRPAPLPPLLSAEEEAAHREFVKTLGAEAVWLQYMGEA
jgi:DNA polymerase-3 subunit epsilon